MERDDMPVVCPHCGAASPRSLVATLCTRCGKGLGDAPDAPPAPEPPPPPKPPALPDVEAPTSASAPASATPDDTGFRLTVEDVFSIAGRGTIACGRVAQGVLHLGEELVVEKPDGHTLSTACGGLEAFRRVLEEAHPGDNIGVLLRGLDEHQVSRGDVLRATAPVLAMEAPPGPPPLSQVLSERGLPPLPPDVEAEIMSLLGRQQVIPAIKALRDHCPSLSLREAKDVLEGVVFALHGEGFPGTGRCFIATAACGTPQAPAVATLREFREAFLRPSPAGRGFIRWYEHCSPRPAEAIAQSPTLRALARHAIVAPAARLAHLWLRRTRTAPQDHPARGSEQR